VKPTRVNDVIGGLDDDLEVLRLIADDANPLEQRHKQGKETGKVLIQRRVLTSIKVIDITTK
jgi:hypothetical protein